MKYIKSFQDFLNENLNEGKDGVKGIPVYAPGMMYKIDGTISWPSFAHHAAIWMEQKQAFIISVDFAVGRDNEGNDKNEYDEHIADPKYRSIPLGTWNDEKLPLYSETNPRKKGEIEFDLISIEKEPGNVINPHLLDPKGYDRNLAREAFLRIVDKKGTEYLIKSDMVLDVQKGCSIVDGIFSGTSYLIKSEKATITDYKNGIVYIKFKSGKTEEYPIKQWKAEHFRSLNEEIAEIDMDKILESESMQAINEDETQWAGLITAALSAAGVATALITAYILDVKKYKKAHPDEDLKSVMKKIHISAGKDAAAIRDHIG